MRGVKRSASRGVLLVAAGIVGVATVATSYAQAQDVTSFAVPGAPRIDGIYIAPDGRMYGAGTFRGTEVYRIHDDGTHETIASGLAGPVDLGMDAEGNLYSTNFNDGSVSRIAPDGTVHLHAEVPAGPAGIVVDSDGTAYVAHYGSGNGTGRSISRIAPDGTVSEFARSEEMVAPLGLARGGDGALYAADFYDGKVFRIEDDGTLSLFAQVVLPGGRPARIGHISAGGGGLIATAGPANRLYMIDGEGNSRPLAGDGTASAVDGPLNAATFNHPNGLAEAPDGAVFVATAGNGPGDRSILRRITWRTLQ